MTELLRLATAPEASNDWAIFGDGVTGEIWNKMPDVKNNEDGFWIQWRLDDELLSVLRNDQKARKMLDNISGITMTRFYPARTCRLVEDAIGRKRIIILTDMWGREKTELIKMHGELLQEVKAMAEENRLLKNRVGYLEEQMDMSRTRMAEYIENNAGMFKNIL